MRNFSLVYGVYEMELTPDQWDNVKRVRDSDDAANLQLLDDFLDAVQENTNFSVSEWTLDVRPYLLVEIEPETEDDIPTILNGFETAFVETFGDFE